MNPTSEVPAHWSVAALEDVCDVVMGQSPPGETYNTTGDGLPFFQGKAEFGEMYPSVRKWCSAPTKTALEGDVLVSVRAPVGPTNLAPGVCCIGRGLAAVRPKAGLDSRYLLYALREAEQTLASMGTGTTFSAITGKDLRSHQIRIAPPQEQAQIVAEIEKQFTRLDAGVKALTRLQAHLRRYRRAVLKGACEGRLTRASGGTPMRVVVGLSSIAEVQLGQQRAPIHANAVVQMPYVRAANITWEGLNVDDIKTMGFPNPSRYRLRSGDVLLVEASGSPMEAGKPAIWRDQLPECYYQKTLIRVRPRSPDVLSEFLYVWFMNDAVSGKFARMAPGVGIVHLTAERLQEWPVWLPSVADQYRIVDAYEQNVSQIDAAENAVRQALQRAGILRASILKQAFKGDLLRPTSSDNPPEALRA